MNAINIETQFNREWKESSLYKRYQKFKEEKDLRRRDMADVLNVSEAELIDHQCGVKSVRLNQQFGELIKQLPTLGYIMSLTRNEYAVHERKGKYDNITVDDPMALVITEDRKIDLRIILHRWKHGFAVQESTESGPRYSLQFFDQSGTAIQKIFLQADSDVDAYVSLLQQFRAQDQLEGLKFSAIEDVPGYVNDRNVDVEKLTSEWLGMTDVHQFFGILKKHNVSREQAFRLVDDNYAQMLDTKCFEDLLTQAVEQQIPIMCFVGNRGNIQIHSGVIHQLKRMGSWLNVLDPEFNLHLQAEGFHSAWLVRKPADTGWVTSVEFYDRDGQLIVQFFGVRREGNEENPVWRDLAESLVEKSQRVA